MQPGFFDLDNRHLQLEALDDPLPRLNEIICWEEFRPILQKIYSKQRKSNAGRKPYDVVFMFKVLVLQHLYNLADDHGQQLIPAAKAFAVFFRLVFLDQSIKQTLRQAFC